MRKIVFGWDANICGVGGFSNAEEFKYDISDTELHEIAWDYAVNNAEDDDDTYQEIGCYWEDYIPEKHDQLKPGGGSWF